MSLLVKPSLPLGKCLVVGGMGFLGSHIVKTLLSDSSCTSVAVLDLYLPIDKHKHLEQVGAEYFLGDITDYQMLLSILEQVKPTVIFNTASPHAYLNYEDAQRVVEVNGMSCKPLSACQRLTYIL